MASITPPPLPNLKMKVDSPSKPEFAVGLEAIEIHSPWKARISMKQVDLQMIQQTSTNVFWKPFGRSR